MTALHRSIHVLLAIVLIVSTGVASGMLAQRWGAPEGMLQAANRLVDAPGECGSWRLLSETRIDPDLIEMLDCAGSINRSYQNVRTSDTVHVAIVVGPPGPIAVHTPEICYATQGFRLNQAPARMMLEVGDKSYGEFVRTTFTPDGLGVDGFSDLIAYHSFSDGGSWQAPARPRFAFGGRGFLMKLQLASRTRTGSGSGLQDPCRDFLESFLPALAQAGIPGR